MKKIYLIFIFLSIFSISNAQEITWLSIEEAIKLNKKKPKIILIDIYTDWCGWCKKLDKVTYKNPEIIKLINKNFYAVKLDGEEKKDITFKDYTFKFKQEGNTKYNEFAAAIMNGKLSYPTTIIMGKDANILDRIPGYLEPKLMEKILSFFKNDIYKSTKWQDFDKNFKSNIE